MTIVSLATLAIQTEAWLQEELGTQQAFLAVLARIEEAAREGQTAVLARAGRELEELVAASAAREGRRAALVAKLSAAAGAAQGRIALSRLVARLAEEGVATERLERMRAELRGLVASVARAGRRLSAVARYHRGLLEELCGLLSAGSAAADGHLVDARA